MEITDEMVQKAQAIANAISPDYYYCTFAPMRAALEAVAPALRAQGMREAATLPHTRDTTFLSVRDRILARAAELEK